MTILAINPATGEELMRHEEMSSAEIERIVAKADDAFKSWRTIDFALRAARMRRAASILREDAGKYAALITREMGKPLRDAVAEVHKCSLGCDYFAEHAQSFLAPEPIAIEASRSFVTFQPLGVILGVMPWNFPFWQAFRFAVPALMAGNAAVLKHASNVPGCALAIEEVFRRAGFPADLFRTLMIGSRQVDSVIANPLVRAVSLTGSTDAGRAVAAKAGAVLKKTVLELGGSDPYLVLEDADIEQASTLCTKARLINSGQSCIAGKRFVVIESVRARFEELFVRKMAAAKVGDPLREDTEVGPLARADLRETVHRQVTTSIQMGARCLLGGRKQEGAGFYYPPTVLTGVRKGMPAYDEEVFGPVAAIIGAKDEAEAITIGNDTEFGLGSGVLTRDLARGERIASFMLESGMAFVNDAVRSDPRLPFGGVKHSGYGRELSEYGIKEFVNIKTVYVAGASTGLQDPGSE
jgi:succinate-semialdehyde dehydrogenase/glutarate-semialdehyde dehydrogenase